MALIGRTFVATAASAAAARFTIVQYNILADRAIPRETGGHDICGSYSYCPATHRYMESRHPRIIAELLELDADVICLQEVEAAHYFDQLKPDLARHGYGSLAHQRWYDHIGLAIFYRKATFELEDERSALLHACTSALLLGATEERCDDCPGEAACDQSSAALFGKLSSDATLDAVRRYMADVTTLPQFGLHPPGFLMARLRHRSSGRLIAVGNMHVFWGHMEYPCVQILEVACAVAELKKFAGSSDVSVVLAGDFNVEPGMPAYRFLECGQLPKEVARDLAQNSIEKDVDVGGMKLVDLCASLSAQIPLQSAYSSVLGHEPALTCADDGEVPGKSRPYYCCLDYIWYDNRQLTASGVLTMPDIGAIKSHYALPSVVHPSDHLSLKAELAAII